MALNPSTAFVGRITAPSAEYPYGSAKNESAPGAGDGTPYNLTRANDIFGFQQALLTAASIVPSGDPDEVGASEYLQALQALFAEKAMGLEWKTGLLVSNNSGDSQHDVDIAAGSIMDTTNVYRMTSTSTFTKQIDATWAAGSAAGGLSDDDTLGNNTWYGLFMLGKSTDATAFDYIFATTLARSLSDAAATAAGYDISRLIDVKLTDGSANIINEVDDGDGWKRYKAAQIPTTITASTAAALVTVAVPPFMIGNFNYRITPSDTGVDTVGFGLLTSTAQTDIAASITNYTTLSGINAVGSGSTSIAIDGSGNQNIKVDASSQIRHRESSEVGSANLGVVSWKMLYTVTDLV